MTEYEADPFPGQLLSPPLADAVLLDRYQSHTQHCASCRTDLANIQRLRLGIAIAGAILWAVLPLLTLWLGTPSALFATLMAIIPLTAGGIWLWLGNLERQFYQGRAVPPRNLPEKRKQ